MLRAARSLPAAGVVFALLLSPLAARADDALSQNGAPPYRAQVLAVDVAGAGLFLAGVAAQGQGGRDTAASDALMLSGGLVFPIGGPVVHLAHREYARAGWSIGLRLALPLAGAFLGGQMADCRNGQLLCGLNETVGGLLLGEVAASLLDVTFLAGPHDPEPAPQAPPRLILSPLVAARDRLLMLGLGGRY